MATNNAVNTSLSGQSGTGTFVGANSPILITPNIGTPSAGNLTNCNGLPVTTGISGLAAGIAAFLATPSSANLITAMTDETGSGSLVFNTSPTFITPILGAASATSITFTSTSGIIGTTTNDNAAAGSVGELIESQILVGSAVSLTTATPANVTSISLTAGDWDVWGNIWFNAAGATLVTIIQGAINNVSATLPTAPGMGARERLALSFTMGQSQSMCIGQISFSLAATTTIYLIAQATFITSTLDAYGYIGARRRR